jgi:hypothetical protein
MEAASLRNHNDAVKEEGTNILTGPYRLHVLVKIVLVRYIQEWQQRIPGNPLLTET